MSRDHRTWSPLYVTKLQVVSTNISLDHQHGNLTKVADLTTILHQLKFSGAKFLNQIHFEQPRKMNQMSHANRVDDRSTWRKHLNYTIFKHNSPQ